jgi:hypothetical protein
MTGDTGWYSKLKKTAPIQITYHIHAKQAGGLRKYEIKSALYIINR